jgi:hypothetical protein
MVRAPMAPTFRRPTALNRTRMGNITDLEADTERNDLAQCRELLDDEAAELSDEQVEAIRQHAQAMAHVLVEIFLTADSRS